jgi:hypothetical protein
MRPLLRRFDRLSGKGTGLPMLPKGPMPHPKKWRRKPLACGAIPGHYARNNTS